MKIAAITDDGQTISKHFGRAAHYLVVTVEDDEIVNRELREKLGHAHFSHESHDHHHSDAPHGMGPRAAHRHARMAEAIQDCEALLCGGMGYGAYESLRERGIRPIVTDIDNIDDAVQAYIEGRIEDHWHLLH